MDGAENASRNGDDDRDEQCCGGEFECRWQSLGEQLHDGSSTDVGAAEITLEDSSQPVDVLDDHWLVQSMFLAEGIDDCRRRCLTVLLPKDRPRGVTGCQKRQPERKHGDTTEDDKRGCGPVQ